MGLRDDLYKVLNEYSGVYDRAVKDGNHKGPLLDFFNKNLRESIEKLVKQKDVIYKVKSSTGEGRVAGTPWIAIMHPSITTKASKGIYITYLFNKNSRDVYLTLMSSSKDTEDYVKGLGCTGREKTLQVKELLQDKKREILDYIDSRGFSTDENLDSGKKDFDIATILYKKYSINSLPEDNELEKDLFNMIDIYGEYVEHELGISNDEDSDDMNKEDDGVITISIVEAINRIKEYIASKGFSYNDGLIENFYLSLKSKPFVILAGTSGTGKTRLVKLFAESIGAEFKLVPVRPDWSDSSDLFGHLDLNGKFVEGALINCIKDAMDNPSTPYMICLDEMNLARVEYYLSDFLSIIETRDMVEGKIVSEPLMKLEDYGNDEDAKNKFGELVFPSNLYIVGTVNMDETTFPFSKKVLDRANTIEFSYVDLKPDFSDHGQVEPLKLSNEFLESKYLLLNQCDDEELVLNVCDKLQQINEILKQANAHVGYRVRDEIVFYMMNNKNADDLLNLNDAMDNAIMQKILPRLQGSSASVKKMLCELLEICNKNDNGSNCKYKNSAEKIAMMVQRFEEDGFTSYWL